MVEQQIVRIDQEIAKLRQDAVTTAGETNTKLAETSARLEEMRSVLDDVIPKQTAATTEMHDKLKELVDQLNLRIIPMEKDVSDHTAYKAHSEQRFTALDTALASLKQTQHSAAPELGIVRQYAL